jgi:AcrR family transcriptional regulator
MGQDESGQSTHSTPGARKRATRRQRLTERALDLFLERGYDETTVDDIVAAADVSRSTFFRYFTTKDDVVLSMLDEMGEDLVRRYRDLLPTVEPVHALPRSLLGTVRVVRLQPRIYELLSLTVSTPLLRQRLAMKVEEWREALEVETVRNLGCRETELYPAVLTSIMVGAATGAADVWIREGGRRDILDVLDEALAMVRRGIGAVPAPQAPGGQR